MTHFEDIKKMDIDELSEYFAGLTFPNSPCYVCEYDNGMLCTCPFECTKEHCVMLYKEWLGKQRSVYDCYQRRA